jgi:integral membrane sensor domain MASE1
MGRKAKGADSRRRRFWLRLVVAGLLYYGLGRLVWLAVPPGHASALWPSSGVCLALLLMSQDLSAPLGAVLGSFALFLPLCLKATQGMPTWQALAVAAVVGLGAGLEVLASGVAVQRWVTLRAAVNQAGPALRLALISGPLPALLGAAAAVGALFWARMIAPSHLVHEAALWWAGDTLGLVVFAPLVLVLTAPVRQLAWRRRLSVAVPILAVTALSVVLFVRADRWDRRRGEAVVRERAETLTGAVERGLVYNLDALRTAAEFLAASGKVEPESFRRVATGLLVRTFSFGALAWAPAPMDASKVVVQLVDPGDADPALLGTDLGGETGRRDRLAAARHDGEPVVADAPPGDGRTLWVFVPAPGRNGEDGVAGFLGGLLRLDLLVDRAASGVDRAGLGLELRDGERLLHRLPDTPMGGLAEPLPGKVRMFVADRAFTLVPVVGGAALAAQRSGEAWIVLVAGMLLAALLQGVLLVATSRAEAMSAIAMGEWRYEEKTELTVGAD